MTETAWDDYVSLRGQWHALVTSPDEPMRSAWKDELFDRLTRAWNRLKPDEKRCMGFHCRMTGIR